MNAKSEVQKSSERKKKSLFQKFSFKKKKVSKQKDKDKDGLSDSRQIEQPNLNLRISQNTVLPHSYEHIEVTDSSSDDIPLLLRLDTPSCFLSNSNISDLPNTHMYQSALNANRDNLKRLTAKNGADYPEVNVLKLQTAEVYKGLGMLRESATLLQEVIESYQCDDNHTPLLLSSAVNDLALVYASLHLHSDAEDTFHKAVQILSQTVEADQAIVWGNIAMSLRETHNYSKAIPMHELAVKMMDSILGKESADALFQRAQLAVTLKKQAALRKAEGGEEQDGSSTEGEEKLAECILQLEALGYGSCHVWIKDLLR